MPPPSPLPPPATATERLLRATKFWSATVPVIATYYATYARLAALDRVYPLIGRDCLTDDECRVEWERNHEYGADVLATVINDLKGFYVKTGQIIASRQDLFPKEYTEALKGLTDYLDPMPLEQVRAVLDLELRSLGLTFPDVFEAFDPTPLGAASVAQVHKAALTPRFGGGPIAVKVQRPGIEGKLMGDVRNLVNLSRPLRGNKAMPVDYFVVFSELEAQLADEFDFLAEAGAMRRIRAHLSADPYTKRPRPLAITMPQPKEGLVTRRMLCMDFLPGVPLSRAAEEMKARGIEPDSPEARLFGEKLLGALTDSFAKSILELGFFHADPHPGNIFVLENGDIGLIDFGQVKQISEEQRRTLAKVMVALDDRESDSNPEDLKKIGDLALELGVELREDAKPEGPAAVAMWLFDGSVEELPGGYDKGELSPNSPVKELKSFPQDLVLVGRSTVLLKGLSSRLGIPWSLSHEWSAVARTVLNPPEAAVAARGAGVRLALAAAARWLSGRVERAVMALPAPLRTRLLGAVLRWKKLFRRRAA
ncbi:hypothetical protein TeGR_g12357 [Tetraparma gracilis]|uniref:ABC1 atypical kinase-like domain-containing protein n=1 Tax=Tetraparma gracilis TaxID=2962635 RepID=A0ABQ6MXN8_9STRA|nr:hypothetical protein TeGR_g12357 [Tetraparma gracilis]